MDMTAPNMRGIEGPLLMAANLPRGAKNQLAGLAIEGRLGLPHQPGFDANPLGISLEKTPAVTVVVAVNRAPLVAV